VKEGGRGHTQRKKDKIIGDVTAIVKKCFSLVEAGYARPFNDLYLPRGKRRQRKTPDFFRKGRKKSLSGHQCDAGHTPLVLDQSVEISRDLQTRGTAADHEQVRLAMVNLIQDTLSCLQKIDDRFNRDHLFGHTVNTVHRHTAAGIERDHVIIDRLTRCEAQQAVVGLNLFHMAFDKSGAPILHHFLDVESNLLGAVNS
jgi:hypothetical protein